MACVIITRPTEQAGPVTRLLKENGYTVIHAPVLAITARNDPMPSLLTVDALLVTSANAFVGADLPPLLRDLPCYCVGASSAQAARDIGVTQVVEGASDGVAIAEKLATDFARGAKVLHLCGQDVEARAYEPLSSAGISVVPWVRYEALLMSDLAGEASMAIKAGEVTAVMVYSSRSAQNFVTLARKAGIFEKLQQVDLVAISQTVANLLNPVEWRRIAIAAQPSDEAMVRALRNISTLDAVSEGKSA